MASGGWNNNNGYGFWENPDKTGELKSIWQQNEQDMQSQFRQKDGDGRGHSHQGQHQGRRCLVMGPDIVPYPVPKDFNLGEVLEKYGGQITAHLQQSRMPTTVQENWNMPWSTSASGSASGSRSGSSTGSKKKQAGCNREDAAEFASRYGVDAGLKPMLYYRMRKGKYRKEF